jgi:hypothetical protein
MLTEERGPFLQRLLDPALAEVALSGRNQRFDLIGVASLADSDELNVGSIAPGEPGRGGDAV